MIILLVLLGGLVLRRGLIAAARRRVAERAASGGHDHSARARVSAPRQHELEQQPWPQKLTSRAAWSDAATYTMADLTMLRRELVIGYVVAGFLAVLVPAGVWNAMFVHGHGIWTSIENALVGPVIAFLSFVCSIGNVPLAAALWNGGISFGGVISFIFADLLAAPLVLIYRRYYGGALTLRLVGVFWAVMAAAGLAVQAIFSAAGMIPTERSGHIVDTSLRWNYTTFLNIVFLIGFAYLYWLYRNRERMGGGAGYAIDPVCGMQIRSADAPASYDHDGRVVHFCSDRCATLFRRDPTRYQRRRRPRPDADQPSFEEESAMATDPVCGMTVDPATAAGIRSYNGRNYFFCATGCGEAFAADPARYLQPSRSDPDREGDVNADWSDHPAQA
jgi:YHS domain-containing protein